MRARLAASERPNRLFEVTLQAARQAGLVGVRRVLDSTPLYDAVATMDTVTLLGAAIRGVLKVAEEALAAELRGCLPAKTTPVRPSRRSTGTTRRHERRWWMRALGTRTRCWGSCRAARWRQGMAEAARLVAAVVGQDLEQDTDGSFRIARKVAADRVISVVDPEARHGHQTSTRGFDGYKGHASVDPASEPVMATTTAGNRW